MRLFRLSLLLIGALTVFAYAKAGTERIDLSPITKVLVVSSPSPGKYSSRVGLVHAFTDAIIVVCLEQKNSVVVQCLVLVNDGVTLMVPIRLLEEKT